MKKRDADTTTPAPTTPPDPDTKSQVPVVPTPAPIVPAGFEDLLDDDLVIPRYAIVQPTSHEGTPGTFRSNLSGEERTELHLVPLRIQRGRVLWSDTLGEEPICKSLDGIVPSPTVERPVHDTCSVLSGRRLRPTCPTAMWQRTPNGDGPGRNEPPQCRDTYSLIGLDLETGAPFAMSFRGTGIRAVRVLRTLIFQKHLALYDAECVLRLRREQNGKGSYYVPEFGDVRQVNQPGMHRSLYDQFARYDVEDPLDSEREVTETSCGEGGAR
jgi:hypothetical protein